MALNTGLRDCEGNMIFEHDHLQHKDTIYCVAFGYYALKYDDNCHYGFFLVDTEYNTIHAMPFSENYKLKLKNIDRCD